MREGTKERTYTTTKHIKTLLLRSRVKTYNKSVMCFRKPWLRVKLINFDFSAKLSSTDYKESNKLNPKSLAHIGSEELVI